MYTLLKPSNETLDAATVKRYCPAAILTEVVSYFAGCILLAIKRFHTSWYRRNWSLLRNSFTAAGVLVTSVGRIASCASWMIFLSEVFFASPSATYSSPNPSLIYSLTAASASSEIRVESVRRYVIRPTVPLPLMSTPSYNCCAIRIVLAVAKFSALDASCWSVLVVKGTGAFFVLSPFFMSATE